MEGRRGKGRGDASGVEDHAPQKRGLRGLRVRTTAGLPPVPVRCVVECVAAAGTRNVTFTFARRPLSSNCKLAVVTRMSTPRVSVRKKSFEKAHES